MTLVTCAQYSHLLYGENTIRALASKELKPFFFWERFCSITAILIPLVSVLMLLMSVKETVDQFQVFRTLLFVLVALAIFGLIFALKLTRKISHSLSILTGIP
jgi:hypothetical protein